VSSSEGEEPRSLQDCYTEKCTYHDHSLVSDPLDVEAHIVQSEGYALDHVVWVLIEVLQELLDIDVPTLEERAVVDVDHDRVKVVVFLLLIK